MLTFDKLGRMPILLTVPALATLLVVFGIPSVQLFLTSLNAPSFSVANYRAFFEQQANLRVLFQTIEMSVVATTICVIIGYPTAYLIVSAQSRHRVVLLVLVFIPWLTSGLVRTYAWVEILGDRGLINNVLLHLGFVSSPLQLIFNRLAVYVGMVHIMLPVMILPLISVMMGIDKSLMTAARSMGAKPFTAFWYVFFPLSLPGVRSGALLVFIFCLGFYITPQALGGVQETMLSTLMASELQNSLNLGPVAASSFILLAITAAAIAMFGLDMSGKQGLAPQPAVKSRRVGLPLSGLSRHYINEPIVRFRAKSWPDNLYRARAESGWWKIVAAIYILAVMGYILFPSLVIVLMSFSPKEYMEFPPSSLSLRWYRSFFADPSWTEALGTSIQLGIWATVLSTVVGTLAAFGLSRTQARLRSPLTMVILTPIIVPSIVVGVAIFFGLYRLGLIGTRTGIILAHSIIAIGSVVAIVSATLANFDRRLEQAAYSMRANPMQTFMRVSLPLIRPGIIGGAVFAFISSFDEVVITQLVSMYSVRTLPLKMWENVRNEIDPTIAAVGSMLTLLPVIWLVILYFMWWRRRLVDQPARL
ncbi:ABC transporter permease subunit [Mesorhizobium sp. M2A.F.Ca.ET.040.01.1.1]|nr:ABC transporter permease subunit [Mesorhizobium sp. M2A.F.Ca.ET.040.01.1.1]